MQNPQSRGMINGNNNILGYPCKDIGKTVPYFKKMDESEGDINEYLIDVIRKLHAEKLVFSDKNF